MKICEIFRSLQGEGTLIGVPTTFIRTTGCNLDCAWCDTKYARKEGNEMSLEDIVHLVEEFKTHFVSLTGGEPMMHKDTVRLMDMLLDEGFHVTLETNGSYTLEDLPCSMDMIISMDFKCPSSGMEKKMDLANLELLSPIDQLKFIVADHKDMMFAMGIINEHKPECNVIFTPVDGLDLGPVADFVLKKKLNVRVLPQLHKIIWGEVRGR